MNAISEIKIVGFDEDRPPRVRKEAYIDLFFKLSEKAPEGWCDDFNILGRQVKPSPKIDNNKGECIDSYVGDMDQIATHLAQLKQMVSECNAVYLEKIRLHEAAVAASNSALLGQDGEQNKLNEIIATLDFDS